jgi:ribonuclease HI
MARCVWALMDCNITDHISSIQEPEARTWINTMIEVLNHQEQTRFFVTLWAIWYARRKAIHDEEFQSPLSTKLFIDRFVSDLEVCSEKERIPRVEPSAEPGRWMPPPIGHAKIHVDAAIGKNMNKASVVAVARSIEGEYLGASSVVFQGRNEPEMLEAMACREALALASDLVITKLVITSDCLNVVKSFKEGTRGCYAHVILEIKARSREFESVVLVHENRKNNKEAHTLARSSLYNEVGRHVWLVAPPEGVCIPHNIMI